MNQRVIRADKAYRNKVLVLLVLLVSLGTLIIGWGLPWMQEDLRSRNPEEALQFMKVALVLLFLGILPMALTLLSFGRKIISTERFPPPGVRVIRDTELLEGERAKQRGRALVIVSVILVLVGLCGAFYVPHLLEKLSLRSPDTTLEGGDSWG